MKKSWKRLVAVAATCVMASTMTAGLAACGGDNNNKIPDANLKKGTERSYTNVMPSNWNELNYSDNNDRQILDYIGSSFFEYDYEFDEALGGKFNKDGTINADAIVPGGFTVNYSAATKLEDVTDEVDAKWGYTAEQKKSGGYAYKITLREDLKWHDGTAIDAKDFVYSMQQQLDPDFMNMRASTYYNNITIKNARDYLYNGKYGYAGMISSTPADEEYFALEDMTKTTEGTYQVDGKDVVFNYKSGGVWGPKSLNDYFNAGYFGWKSAEENDELGEQWIALTKKCDKDGYVKVKEDDVRLLWNIIAVLQGCANVEEYAAKVGDYAYLEWEEFCYYGYIFDNMEFSEVGLYSTGDYELVVCLDNPIMCLKEDGSLSYEAAYSFASLPLVKKDLYESLKKAPQEGSTLWTTTYNTSYETSASWGPYKLTGFQSGKQFTLERNDNWYGYALEENTNQYNVNKIVTECIPEKNTQWTKFFAGEIDGIAIDSAHKDGYRNSKYAYFTPGTGTYALNLYADLNGLKASGHNSGILAIDDFRKAISLSFDRDDYNAKTTTAHQTCYGILGPSYYYDVENGGVYRDSEYAKKGLLRVYGFTENENGTWTDGNRTYSNYEDAYDAMNGMNKTLAKELIQKAYTELTSNSEKYGYDASKKIKFVYGTSVDNAGTRIDFDYLVEFFDTFTKGTALEGKIELVFDASFGNSWADDFKGGAYEIASGTGFGGGPFDPAGVLQCYLDPEAGLMYSTWWDTKSENLTFTMPAGDYAGAGTELTMSLYNWYCCLNGIAESRGQRETYNWSTGFAPESARLQLLSKLEEVIISKYYSIFTTSQFTATLLGAKFSYITDEHNIFLGYGGYRYMIVNYTDSEWDEFVKSKGNLEDFYKAVD